MGQSKPSAREAFDLNMADARILVDLVKLLDNQRKRGMRREQRERFGEGLRVAKGERSKLECIANHQVFIVFRPGFAHWRERLTHKELSPLLRQALVAACAAVETFCADRVMERYPTAIRMKSPPERLGRLTMTVGDHLGIKEKYLKRPGTGLRVLVDEHVRSKSSPAPSEIGKLFALVDEKDVLNRVDGERKKKKGESAAELERIVERRNKIAHTGDRKGRGRAEITVKEVEADLACITAIIDALDKLTAPKPVRTRKK